MPSRRSAPARLMLQMVLEGLFVRECREPALDRQQMARAIRRLVTAVLE